MGERRATGWSGWRTRRRPARYIRGWESFDHRPPPRDATIVILDDVAGSGSSLEEKTTALIEKHEGPIVVAPMMSTEEAAARFAKNESSRGKVIYMPYKMTNTLNNSQFYRALISRERTLLNRAIYDPGYGGNALSMVFPYMAPDNNNAFFGKFIAHHFIVNKTREATKTGWFDPPRR